MSRRGRRHADALGQVDREHEYQPAEAVALVRSLSKAKFDESIEVHVRTGLNVRHADEQLRGTIALPNGVGKDVKIAVFAQGEAAREAEQAGADYVGGEDLAKRVQDGFTDFDVAIALNEFEDTADCAFGACRFKRNDPREVGIFRIDVLHKRQFAIIDRNVNFSETPEFAQQNKGLVRIRIQTSMRPKADDPRALLRRR